MGRPISRDFEDELIHKLKTLFDKIVDGINKENPSYPFDFERFVESFNTDDYITKQVFEFFVKEAAHSYRRANPFDRIPLFPRPSAIHHTAVLGGPGSASPFTSLSSSLSSLAFDNNSGLHHDSVQTEELQSEGEQAEATAASTALAPSPPPTATTSLDSGLAGTTNIGTNADTGASTSVRVSQRSLLTPNPIATSGNTLRSSRNRPWSDQRTVPDLEVLTQLFSRSRARRSRERARTNSLMEQLLLFENDNSGDSDTSDDSIYDNITQSRSNAGAERDSNPSSTLSPGRNPSIRPQNNFISFTQSYPPISASPSSPSTFSSPPSNFWESAFTPSNLWDPSTASRANRLQRMSRYIFDDSSTARLRQPGYINSFERYRRQRQRRIERYRDNATSFVDNLSLGPSSSSSALTVRPSTTASVPSTVTLTTTTDSTSPSTTSVPSAHTLNTSEQSEAVNRPTENLNSESNATENTQDMAAPSEDRYSSFAEASRRGRAALRLAALALDETARRAENS
ncbi:hypothetical protein FBU30_004555 [Linnemannia zychae]|nr:hypothetical protein FBU30_004555 [Linnemannia zychae]